MTFNPTDEQIRALELFGTGKSLVIEAGAGAGKTSTLKLLAESTGRRGQYLAFNKAIVEESKAKMPGTVRCNTAHSAAFRVMVRKMNLDRLRSGRMKSWDIARFLGIDQGIGLTTHEGTYRSLSPGYLAGLTMRSVTKFCQSADDAISSRHVPYIRGIDAPGDWTNNRQVADAIRPYASKAWADLMRRDGALPFQHDHYLKAWQLDDPRIDADYILFDEAQDANPVMVDIVAKQRHRAQLVWVGDSQQQIYEFTGAVNALQAVGAEQEAYLTQSFRFGPAVAEVANSILAKIEGAKLRLTGTPSIASTVGPVEAPNAILTRTNAEAVRNVLMAQSDGKRPHLVGGGNEIVSFAKAAQTLMDGGKTEHPELACFASWNEVREYVEQDEQGGDLRLLVRLIDEFTVPTILAALDNMVTEQAADVIVSTAHKSKGREWDSVQLGADFEDPEDNAGELRLIYVAVTRAKLRLDHTAAPFVARIHETIDITPGAAFVEAVMGEIDHEAPGHDFASCPDCIRRAREAEHEAEGACTAACAPETAAESNRRHDGRYAEIAADEAVQAALEPARIAARHVTGTADPDNWTMYVGRSGEPQHVSPSYALSHALNVYQRTGKRVVVLDGAGELVVEYDQ